MGSGIVQVAAQNGHDVVLVDLNEQFLHSSEDKLVKILSRLVEKGRITDEQKSAAIGRIAYGCDIQDLADCDIVIEAIIENLNIKCDVFAKLEQLCKKGVILASNTSSLSIASIGAALEEPSKIIGIHFFNPAPLMPLVEIIPAVQTSDSTLKKAKDLIDNWGKVTVLCKDTPGFIVNRVARPFYSEALRIYEEGISDLATIDSSMTEIGGFRMGPFTLMDYIGNDVNYAVTESVWRSCYFEPRYKPAFTQRRLVDAGYLGRKSGKGYYDYSTSDNNSNNNGQGSTDIFNRILCMLINEAAEALYWGVANRDDIDLAMTKGVNYPKGLLAWCDEIGVGHVVDTLDDLFGRYHEERYRCSVLLRQMAAERTLFYENQ